MRKLIWIGLISLTACGERAPDEQSRTAPPAERQSPATASGTTAAPPLNLDPTNPTDAVKQHIQQAMGEQRVRQIVDIWWSFSRGGWVAVRLRDDRGKTQEHRYWVLSEVPGEPCRVFESLPRRLDSPVIIEEIAKLCVKAMGERYIGHQQIERDWVGLDALPDGSTKHVRVAFRDSAPQDDADYITGTRIPKMTHEAICTITKFHGSWCIEQIGIYGAEHAGTFLAELPAPDRVIRGEELAAVADGMDQPEAERVDN